MQVVQESVIQTADVLPDKAKDGQPRKEFSHETLLGSQGRWVGQHRVTGALPGLFYRNGAYTCTINHLSSMPSSCLSKRQTRGASGDWRWLLGPYRTCGYWGCWQREEPVPVSELCLAKVSFPQSTSHKGSPKIELNPSLCFGLSFIYQCTKVGQGYNKNLKLL